MAQQHLAAAALYLLVHPAWHVHVASKCACHAGSFSFQTKSCTNCAFCHALCIAHMRAWLRSQARVMVGLFGRGHALGGWHPTPWPKCPSPYERLHVRACTAKEMHVCVWGGGDVGDVAECAWWMVDSATQPYAEACNTRTYGFTDFSSFWQSSSSQAHFRGAQSAGVCS